MELEKLKPCPFCGGEAKTSQGTTDPENKFGMGWIGCQRCQCFINYINNPTGKRLATEAWNRRANYRRECEVHRERADTVRKMRSLIEVRSSMCGKMSNGIITNRVYHLTEDNLDQIEKEMVGVD